jgi:hypothetical protein
MSSCNKLIEPVKKYGGLLGRIWVFDAVYLHIAKVQYSEGDIRHRRKKQKDVEMNYLPLLIESSRLDNRNHLRVIFQFFSLEFKMRWLDQTVKLSLIANGKAFNHSN